MPKNPLASSVSKSPVSAQRAELAPPDWTRARNYLEGIKLAVRISLAGQILLGMELLSLKKQHGFLGAGGDRKSNGHNVHLIKTWPDLVSAELGISYKTADRMIDAYEAAKQRLKRLGGEGHLLGLMNTTPAKLDDEGRKVLAEAVDKLVWGDTQKSLLEELRITKTNDTSGIGKDTSGSKKQKDAQIAEQMAFSFFAPVVQSLHTVRSSKDYQAFLHILPIESADETVLSLTAMEMELQQSLSEVRAAITAKKKA